MHLYLEFDALVRRLAAAGRAAGLHSVPPRHRQPRPPQAEPIRAATGRTRTPNPQN